VNSITPFCFISPYPPSQLLQVLLHPPWPRRLFYHAQFAVALLYSPSTAEAVPEVDGKYERSPSASISLLKETINSWVLPSMDQLKNFTKAL
jgi:hypothetical protein